MCLNKINYSISVILLILTLTNLVRSWRTHDYDDYNPYHRNNHYHEPRSLNLDNYHDDSCHCIQIPDCNTIRHILRQQEQPLSDDFKQRVRKLSCGYNKNNRPLICCPSSVYEFNDPRSRRASYRKKSYRDRNHETEEPWVWDVDTDNSGDSNQDSSQNSFHPNYFNNLYQNQLNNFHKNFGVPAAHGFDGLYSNNLPNYGPNFPDLFNKAPFKFFEFHPHFEDERTKKNCPPSFSAEFQIPTSITGVTAETPTAPPNAINPAMPILTPAQAAGTEEQPAVDVTTTEPPTTTPDPTVFQERTVKQSLINTALCGLSVNTRIVGGEDAGPGQFPWMARLAYRNKTSGLVTYRCAGSVINDRYIVTAAHCVSNLIDDLEVVMVRLGELDDRTDVDCTADQSRCTQSQDYEIERITPHHMYDQPKYANDIALIKLMRSTNESAFISPLCLPVGDYTNAARNITGRSGIISGWGSMTAGTNIPSPMLQWVRLPIVNTTSCASSYARFSANSRTPIIVSQGQMCVQGRENMDACQGDSGGPLMTDGSAGNERYTLLGLVSFGPRTCGVSNFPGVYTRVSSYTDWIMDNLDM